MQDLEDYNRLMEHTQKKLVILESMQDEQSVDSRASGRPEMSDEFLRNFFIKFGMKRTLDSFQ